MMKPRTGMEVSVQSIQKITEQLQPRFVAGNPPDVIDNSGANMIKMADLIAEDLLADMAELIAAPGKTVSETLFAIVTVMTNGTGGPSRAADVLLVYLYSMAFSQGQFGYATAMGLVLLVIVLGLSVMSLRLTARNSIEY